MHTARGKKRPLLGAGEHKNTLTTCLTAAKKKKHADNLFRPLLKCADRPLKTRTNRCRSQSDCLMRTTSAKTEKNPAARAAQVRKHAA